MSCEQIAGHNARVYEIDETNFGETPDLGAWAWMGVVKDLSPTFNPNVVKVTGVGSRRYLDRLDGAWETSLGASLVPKGPSNLVKWLELALGSATGTTEGCLGSKSIEAYLKRGSFFLANLYNGCKVRSMSLSWSYGQPLGMDLDLACQYVQTSKVSSGDPHWLTTYVGFQDLSIASRGAPSVAKPYNFNNVAKPLIDWGAGLVALPPVDTMSLSFDNSLALLPGEVLGDDGLWLPVPYGWAEEAQELTANITVNPKELDAYQRLVKRDDHIEALEVKIRHPDGSGFTETLIRLLDGGIDTGDMSLSELVLLKLPLSLSFKEVEVITT